MRRRRRWPPSSGCSRRWLRGRGRMRVGTRRRRRRRGQPWRQGRRAADLGVIPLGFDDDADRSSGSFELTLDLTRPAGALYGGTGVALSVMAMEAATQRDALWVVTQFVAPAQAGSRLSWSVRTQ